MGTAVKDTAFVFLSNIKDITFEQAWKASGLSSNMDSYFKEKDAKFVAMRQMISKLRKLVFGGITIRWTEVKIDLKL